MYSNISSRVRYSVLELRIYPGFSKLIMHIPLKTISLCRAGVERAQILLLPSETKSYIDTRLSRCVITSLSDLQSSKIV